LLDLAEIDLGERRAVDDQVARLDALEVDDRHDAAHDHRELRQARLVELLARKRRIGGTEGHGLGLDLLDAATRTDRLIVQADTGLLLIGVRPLGVDRVGERGAGAGDVGRQYRQRGRDGRDRGKRSLHESHGVPSFKSSYVPRRPPSRLYYENATIP